MDTIEFEVTSRGDWRGDRILVRINGRGLVDLAQEHEAPMAEAEGRRSIAGDYAGLPVGPKTCPPSRHFFGEASNPIHEYGERIEILVCECGEPGCWPLVCKITVNERIVVWSDFEQPHRRGRRGLATWSYDGFGPFRFARKQYEKALGELGRRPAD